MKRWLKEVGRGKEGARDLNEEEALQAARAILSGEATPAQAAGFLMSVRIKGESPDEIRAFGLALRQSAKPVSLPEELRVKVLDCAGPHDGRKGFAATIPAAVLCAAAGLPSLLHAAPSLPPKQANSLEDLLQAAGMLAPGDPAQDLGRWGLGYCSAESHCPPLARLRGLREELGLRTILNTAEKLLNLASATRLLVGVNHASAMERLAHAGLPEGVETMAIVRGLDGSEDLPVHKPSQATILIRGKKPKTIEIDPKLYGLEGELQQDYSAAEQANMVLNVLSGHDTPALKLERSLTLLNAAFRLWIFGGCDGMSQGLVAATELLHSGKALNIYLSWLSGHTQARAA